MSHLFFSYARKDLDRLEKFYYRLEYELERCLWFDQKDIPDKALWMQEIEQGITSSDGVIFAITANFVDPEREVIHKREIPWSYQHFKDRNNANLYPILFDDVELPELLKTPHITQLIDARDGDMERVYADFKKVIRPEHPSNRPFLVSWPRITNFKGRATQLMELHQKLMGAGRVGVKTAGLRGMGGIGKTQLVAEYAHRYQTSYAGGVYWLNAGENWRKQVVACADRLGLIPIDTSDPDRDKQMVLSFQKHLATQGQDALLVLDNVDDPADVTLRELAPKLTVVDLCQQTRTRLLLTTRVQKLPQDFADVSVQVLQPEDAQEVLLNAWMSGRRKDAADTASLDAIAKSLGYLPLGLILASAALSNKTSLPPAHLLQELRDKGIDHVADKGKVEKDGPAGYVARVNIALEWQIDQLEQPESRHLLGLLAAFGEAAVVPMERLRFLSDLVDDGWETPFKDSIDELTNYHLIELLNDGADIRLHPLIQVYAVRTLAANEALTAAAPYLLSTYRTPSILDTQIRARGLMAVIDDLRSVLPHANDKRGFESFTHLLMLEELHLRTLPIGAQNSYVIQHIRERAYHEYDDELRTACDAWLKEKFHLHHNGLRYPKSKALLRTLTLHTRAINGSTQLKDGRILSWSDDCTLRLWTPHGEQVRVLEGHNHYVKGAMELKDGRLLSWSDDKTLRLWNEAGEQSAVMEGHNHYVKGAMELKDGRLLSWGGDTLLLWDRDGQVIAVLEGHTSRVVGALELKDGRLLSWDLGLKSEDKILRLWSATGELLAVPEWPIGKNAKVLELRDGRLLSWSHNDILRLWSATGELLANLEWPIGGIDQVLELRDGRLLSWGFDETLRLWDTDGVTLAVLEGFIYSVTGAMELKDGRLLSWSGEGTLRLWSTDGDPLAVMEGHTLEVKGVVMLKDGRLLSWSNDSTLRLWNIHGEPLAVMEGHVRDVTGAMELKDGRLLSWGQDETLRLWEGTGATLTLQKGHRGRVRNAVELEDGRLLSWSDDNTLRLWDANGMALAVLEGHTGIVPGAIELRDGRLLSWSWDETLRLWGIDGESLAVLKGHTYWVTSAMELKDNRLLSWSEDKTLRLWDTDGELLAVLKGHTGKVTNALELKGGQLLSWSEDKTLRLWSADGAVLAVLAGHTGKVTNVLELKDGRLLSWSNEFRSEDNTLRLWDAEGTALAVLAGHTNGVTSALELKDGRLLSWSNDSTLRLWNTDGTTLAVLEGEYSVTGAQELKDGRLLSWNGDGTLRLWRRDGAALAVLAGHTSGVNGVLTLADGRLLSWSWDKTLRLWSAVGYPLGVLEGHTYRVIGAMELKDGRLLSWSEDKTLRIWSIDGQSIGTYYSDALITTCELSQDEQRVLIGEEGGRVLVLHLEDGVSAVCDSG